jgi:hypothetical protein
MKKVSEELPPLGKVTRCIAKVKIENEISTWSGYADVFFNPQIGWRLCGTLDKIEVHEWM